MSYRWNFRTRPSLSLILFGLIMTPLGASAAPGSERAVIEEVVVTATYRESALLDTPLAISAVDATALEAKGIIDLKTLYQSIPSMSYSAGGNTFEKVTVRGLSALSGGSALVSIYVDDIPVTDQSFSGSGQPPGALFDLERVEVLRGPQGTLYGESAIAGTVRYITKDADPNEFDFRVTGTAEQSSESDDFSSRVQAVVNVPLIEDSLGLRISGHYRDSEGTLDVSGRRNEDDVDFNRQQGVRAKLNWFATDKLELVLTGSLEESEYGGPGVGSSAYRQDAITSALFPNGATDEQKYANLTVRYDFDRAQFLSSSSYFDRETTWKEQLPDFFTALFEPAADFLRTIIPGLPAGSPVFDSFGTDGGGDGTAKRFVQEFRLVSANEGNLSWTTGLYFSESKSGFGTTAGDGTLIVANPGFEVFVPLVSSTASSLVEIETTEISLYGEVGIQLSEAWDLSLGARVVQADTEALTTDVKFDDDFFSPKATLTWRPNDDWMAYGTISQGFRRGVFNGDLINILSQVQNSPVPVPGGDTFLNQFSSFTSTDGDEVLNYELGFKASFADNRVSLASAIYHMEWDDALIAARFDLPPGIAGANVYTVNGGEAHTRGIEVELTALLTDSLTLTFTGDHIADAEIDRANAALGTTTVMDGARLVDAPDYSLSVALDYGVPISDNLELNAHVDVYRVDDSFSSIDNARSQQNDAFTNVNARLSVSPPDQRWQVSLFGQNLNNDEYTYSISSLGSRYGTPRLVGLELSYDLNGR